MDPNKDQLSDASPAGASIPPVQGGADRSRAETWAGLLAHWTAFAQSAVALPKDAQGDAWRASVPAIVGLQAVCMALGDLAGLDADERAVGCDRAAVLIGTHARELRAAWGTTAMPEGVLDLMDDARRALESAQHLGVLWRVPMDAKRFVMPELSDEVLAQYAASGTTDLLAVPPGASLLAGTPAVHARPVAPDASVLPALERLPGLHPPVQVYRQSPDDQRIGRGDDARERAESRDLVAPYLGELPPGRPLLVPMIEAGGVLPRTRLPALPSVPMRVEHLRRDA